MKDGDYHLVIKDSHGLTMLVESPDPDCAGSSTLASQIRSVRAKIDNAIPGVSKTAVRPNQIVSVEGVGFFDILSGTFGQAPNGIELHPATNICFGSNCKL